MLHTQSKTKPIFLKDRIPSPVLQKEKTVDGFMGDVERVSDFQIELTKYNSEVENALAHAKKVSIDTVDDATSNGDFAGEMRKLSKKIEATKKEITEPARQFVAKVNTLANGYTEKLDEGINLISAKIGKFNAIQTARQLQELEELAIIEAAAGITTDFAIMPVKQTTKTASITTYQTSEWELEIVDFAKIPVEYLMLNEALVKAAIKSGRDTIPGLKITENKVTRIRTK